MGSVAYRRENSRSEYPRDANRAHDTGFIGGAVVWKRDLY